MHWFCPKHFMLFVPSCDDLINNKHQHKTFWVLNIYFLLCLHQKVIQPLNVHKESVLLDLTCASWGCRRWTGRWKWPSWLDAEGNTSRSSSTQHFCRRHTSICLQMKRAAIPPVSLFQEEEALSYVAGFTVANDVSARDWQMKRNGKQWLLGKTFDSFCPLGPALVTTDSLKGERENKNWKSQHTHTHTQRHCYCVTAVIVSGNRC